MTLGYLLDSHVLVWFIHGSRELGKRTSSILEGSDRLAYSPLSIFELGLKQQLGRLELDANFREDIKSQDVDELPFKVDHAIETARFGLLVRHDPFDRMLLAQASFERMNLIAADRHLLSLGLPWVVDARQ